MGIISYIDNLFFKITEDETEKWLKFHDDLDKKYVTGRLQERPREFCPPPILEKKETEKLLNPNYIPKINSLEVTKQEKIFHLLDIKKISFERAKELLDQINKPEELNHMKLTLNELLEWQKENKRIPAIFNSTDHECQVVIDDKLRYAFSGRYNENTKFDVIVNNKETYYVVERFDRYVDGVYSFFASEEPYEKTVSTTKSLLDCYRYDTYEEAKEFADKYNCTVRKVKVECE